MPLVRVSNGGSPLENGAVVFDMYNYGPYVVSYIDPDGNVESITSSSGTFSNGISFSLTQPGSGAFTCTINHNAIAFGQGTNNKVPVVNMNYIANTTFTPRTGTEVTAVFLLT